MSVPVNQFLSLRRQIHYPAVTGQPAQSKQTVLSQAGLTKDRVQFGAGLSPSPEMPFVQKKDISTAGTEKTPISPNNCIVCSAKNLLAYYGYDQETINNVIQGGLAEEINNPRHFEADSPYFPFQNNKDTIELNNNFVREYLSNSGWGFNMNIQPYRIGDKAKIEQAIHESKPLWVFAEHDTHTLAGKALSEGHAYFVAPDRKDRGKWLVLDSWNGVTQLNTEQLKRNLGTMTSQSSQYNVVQNAPDSDLINVYKPGSIGTQHPPRPSQIRTAPPARTQSTDISVEPDTKTSPSSVQESKSEAKPASTNSHWYQRLGQWFKSRWNSFTQSLKRFGNWVKNCFSSKKKTD